MKKLLIIEDEQTLLEALSDVLEAEKFKVIQAVDGEDGLKKALAEKPDLILLDISLPKLNGIEMLDALRKDQWGKDVSVIILTNDKSTHTIEQAITHNSFEYIVKSDWSLENIVAKVKDKLGLHTFATS